MISPHNESAVRLACFGSVFLLLALIEMAAPRRPLTAKKSLRWWSNLALIFLNTAAVRVVLPMGAVGVALVAEERSWGLCNNLDMPVEIAVPLAVIALDLIIYLQHVLFHAVPILWRLHRVHHADLDVDVTTGLRFHTIEIVLSLGIKLAAIILLGASAVAVLIFEVLLNATAMFSHSNIHLPQWLDHWLRCVLVTPDMHRVHHSVITRETNSNFGFNLPWWDFLFGTYRAQPAGGHEEMLLGLDEFRDERVERLTTMLALPFVGPLRDDLPNGNELQARSQQSSSSKAPSDKYLEV